MRENVGGIDRTMRLVLGPAMLVFGYWGLEGRRGNLTGLVAIIGGALVTQSALTKVSPLNEALGIDTARRSATLGLDPREYHAPAHLTRQATERHG